MMERVAARVTVTSVTIALLALALLAQTIRIEGFKFWPFSYKGLKAELATAQDTLDDLAKPQNEQKATTSENIKQGNERIVYVDRIVKPLEQRPVPAEGCATPDLEEWKAVL